MGEYLSQPIRDKISSDAENESVSYGSCAMQGWRKKMEDTHLINLNIGDSKSFNLFGVFDGHGGDEVANYVKAHFTEELCANKAFKEKKYETALKETFMRMDELLRTEEAKKELIDLSQKGKDSNENPNSIKKDEDRQLELFKSLFDPRNLEDCNIAMFTGCTATVCLIVDGEVYLANAGDSKGVVIKEGLDNISTKEHKPTDKEEENRIINANGIIEDKRINGVIDLSRCIGDLEYKKDTRLKANKQILIAEPDVIMIPIKDVDYVVLGCDGFWDYKVEDKAKKDDKNAKIETRVKADIKARKPDEKYSVIIERIFDYILDTDKDKKDKTDNKDNMTCIIVQIKEEAKKEKPKEEPKVEVKEEPKVEEIKIEEKPNKEMVIDPTAVDMKEDDKEQVKEQGQLGKEKGEEVKSTQIETEVKIEEKGAESTVIEKPIEAVPIKEGEGGGEGDNKPQPIEDNEPKQIDDIKEEDNKDKDANKEIEKEVKEVNTDNKEELPTNIEQNKEEPPLENKE